VPRIEWFCSYEAMGGSAERIYNRDFIMTDEKAFKHETGCGEDFLHSL